MVNDVFITEQWFVYQNQRTLIFFKKKKKNKGHVCENLQSLKTVIQRSKIVHNHRSLNEKQKILHNIDLIRQDKAC